MPLDAILKKTTRGLALLNLYERKQFLSDDDQKILINEIIDNFNSRNKYLSVKEIDKYAEEICILFPSESKETYCRKVGNVARGKLANRVRNLKHNLVKKGLIEHKKRKVRVEKSLNEPITTDSIQLPDENEINIKAWLKYNQEDVYWDEIKIKWKDTFTIRRNDCINKPFRDVIEDWPLYKHSKGFLLVEADFNNLFKDCTSLFAIWETFQHLAAPIFQRNIKDRKALQLLQDINSFEQKDYRDYIITKLLHYVLKPTAKIRKPDKKIWKVSITDSISSQILCLNNISDLQRKVSEIRDIYTKAGLKVQPFIIVVEFSCKLHEFYVWTESIIHKFDSFLKALDFCSKVFHVFNFCYTKQSEIVWNFIQKYFYNIYNSQFDISDPAITNLIVELNSLKDK